MREVFASSLEGGASLELVRFERCDCRFPLELQLTTWLTAGFSRSFSSSSREKKFYCRICFFCGVEECYTRLDSLSWCWSIRNLQLCAIDPARLLPDEACGCQRFTTLNASVLAASSFTSLSNTSRFLSNWKTLSWF